MADVHIPDEVLHNILVRLSAKPLLRFRCVSKHWNRLISDPYFMRSRSRRMVLLPVLPLHVLDVNVPIDGTTHSPVKLPSPFKNLNPRGLTMVGTINGIVVLVHENYGVRDMILYNPFTGVSKILPDPPAPIKNTSYVFGFGYGASPDDLKIVRFRICDHSYHDNWDACDVFALKKGSWTTSQDFIHNGTKFRDDVGLFVNGYLHWMASAYNLVTVIVSLNVKTMVVSMIRVPHDYCCFISSILGILNGCLCMINKCYDGTFNMWVMKVQGVDNSWSKAYSFTLRLEDNYFNELYPICILEDGRILMTNCTYHLVIYDVSKDSYKTLNLTRFSLLPTFNCIEYVENLVSPGDMLSG